MRIITSNFSQKATQICILLLSVMPFFGYCQVSLTPQSPDGGEGGRVGVSTRKSLPVGQTGWTVTQPFQRDVFIENKGQFSEEEKKAVGSPICYFTHKGKLFLYFTLTGLIYRYDSIYSIKPEKESEDEEEDDLKNFRVMHLFTNMQWVGCNQNAKIEVENEVPDYFTYKNPDDNSKELSLLAHAWTKLIYKNLYNGIDVEFYFPEKGGIEYNIIVHPGANLAQAKILYSNSSVSPLGKDLQINTLWGKLTDHEPKASDEAGKPVEVTFKISNNVISFSEGNYDKSKTVVIDPWTTSTSLSGSNKAFDLGYDYQGNVYVYGGGDAGYYELQKFNSGGSLVWTYVNSNFTYYYISGYFYGGMTNDHITGSSYMCEGYDGIGGCKVVKIKSNGTFGAQYTSNGTYEMWKIGYDYCNNQLIIAEGNIGGVAATLDTNLITLSQKNIFSINCTNDQAMIGFDNNGAGYIASARMVNVVCAPNKLCKFSLPSMSPTSWIVPDYHTFEEITNISYYPILSTYVCGNGFNGLVATPTYVLTYDGGRLRQWRASNGAIFDSAILGNTLNAWGGLDIGCDGHIYCGYNQSISVYDSNLTSLASISLSSTVYAVLAAPNGNIYACGNGFVQCVAGGSKLATATSTPGGCSCSGSATAHACGEGPFLYSWSNGGTTQTITGLCTGTYTVTITSEACPEASDTAIANLGGGAGFSVNMGITYPLCNGECTGTASVSLSGGHPPYSYSWLPSGSTNSSITALCAGTYTVILKDSSCSDSAFAIITQPPALIAIMGGTPTEVKCFGGNNGLANVTVVGGTTPYTYLWTPSGGTHASGTGLTAGTYTVSVTDANSCTASASVAIIQPPRLSDTIIAQTNILCFGGLNATATASSSGGTTAYRYSWTSSGGTNAVGTGLSAGSYTVTVTDANGCTATTRVVITQPSLLAASIGSPNNVACNGASNGSAIANASGGTPVYTYSWRPAGGTRDTATGLSAGTYTVTVTDSHGCSATAKVTIGHVPILVATMGAPTNILCNGGNNGNATVSVSGGTPAYTYAWTPTGGTNATGTGLSAGTFTVIVTDANGCTVSSSVVTTQPPILRASMGAPTNVICNGGNNGSATVSASGGVSGYTYNWLPAGGTNATGSGLSAGTFTVTVTDAHGCTINDSVTITQPTPILIIDNVISNISCNGGTNGSASVSASGGLSPYTYSWSPHGGTNASATGLSAGTYSINLTDANGCTASGSLTITQPPAMSAIMGTPVNVLCHGGNNGSATVTVSGGAPVYTYSWSPAGGTNQTGTGLSAGNYTVTVTDANQCTVSASVVITQPTALAAVTNINANVGCNGGTNGSATVTVTGGTPRYTYVWAPIGGNGPTATGLSAGTYTVTATDANGCVVTASAIVIQPTPIAATMGVPTNVLCNGGSNGRATVSASGGVPVYTYSWSPAGGTSATGTGLSAGIFTVTVTDANGCTVTSSVGISQPAVLGAVINVVSNVLCNGGSNGRDTVATSGGVLPYVYQWTPNGGTNSTANALTAGAYTITVTDANSCTASASAIITQPPVLTSVISAQSNVTCNGGNNGSASLTASGGTQPYTYSWSLLAGTNAAISGLSEGTYSVTVTDAHNCISSASVTITEPNPLQDTISGPISICAGQLGLLKSFAYGGTYPYSYIWSNGATSSSILVSANPSHLIYSCIVTDANGCTVSATIFIKLGPQLFISISGPTTVCSGESITLCGVATGGVGNKTFTWNPGNVVASCIVAYPTVNTIFTLSVRDDCGADTNIPVPVTVEPLPKINFTANFQEGCAPLCLQFRDLSSLTSGSEAKWLWLFGNHDSSRSQNPLYCYNEAGNYSVNLTVTSGEGCTSSLNTMDYITVYSHPVSGFTELPQPTTILSPTIQFTDKSTDNYGLVYWFWNFGDGSDSSSNLENPSHTYADTGTYCPSLVAMNLHGCTDTSTNCLIISPIFSLYIPSAFTPNNDGVNDVFMPKGNDIKSFEMYIFDRWGMQLFHSTDINIGWNGTVSRDGMHDVSTICQEDTYTYFITATDNLDNKHSYIGEVTLIK